MSISRKSHNSLVIALDAMGGDSAPGSVIDGAAIIAAEKKEAVFFKIYGDLERIKPLVYARSALKDRCEIIHSPQVVSPSDKPSKAVRTLKESSMQMAISAVKALEADAAVSSGNTGVLMAMSVLTLRTLPQIHRPAIVNLMPTVKGRAAVLDLGATVEVDARNLYQFAIMGAAFVKILLNKEKPVVGLLNIGSEEGKGKDSINAAYHMIKEANLGIDFYGYVEGDDIAKGTTDVVVTDGFTGNVVLKAVQGYAKVYKSLITREFKSSLISKIQYLISSSVFGRISKNFDIRRYNGAMLVGLNGVVVKSHGSSDDVSVASAIRVAYDLAQYCVNEQIAKEIAVNLEQEVTQNDNA